MHISKALKAWLKAIQQASMAYNKAVTSFDPPHPKLTWAEIIKYSTISKFDLLCSGAFQDIHNL